MSSIKVPSGVGIADEGDIVGGDANLAAERILFPIKNDPFSAAVRPTELNCAGDFSDRWAHSRD